MSFDLMIVSSRMNNEGGGIAMTSQLKAFETIKQADAVFESLKVRNQELKSHYVYGIKLYTEDTLGF